MSTTSATRSTIRGSLRTASATLVRGPVGTRATVPGSCSMTVSMIRSTPCRGERVAGDLRQRLVAGDGRHGEQLDRRAGVGEQQRDGVVVPGIAVEQD